jgi:hypothetical protein
VTDSIGSSSKALQQAQVMTALRSASTATGVDFGYLMKTAQRESNFDPNAKASTSSATGLFQFTNETWLNVLDRYGARHGVKTDGQSRGDLLALREDAGLSARMAGELAGENAKILERKLGRAPTGAELYAAHFMGPNDAARLVEAARAKKTDSAAELFPRASLANASIFHGKDGATLTSAQLYTRLTGVDVAMADSGKIPAAKLDGSSAPDPSFLLQARMGIAQMSSSLMTALFSLQTNDKRG